LDSGVSRGSLEWKKLRGEERRRGGRGEEKRRGEEEGEEGSGERGDERKGKRLCRPGWRVNVGRRVDISGNTNGEGD
jgi:hypothetical protein